MVLCTPAHSSDANKTSTNESKKCTIWIGQCQHENGPDPPMWLHPIQHLRQPHRHKCSPSTNGTAPVSLKSDHFRILFSAYIRFFCHCHPFRVIRVIVIFCSVCFRCFSAQISSPWSQGIPYHKCNPIVNSTPAEFSPYPVPVPVQSDSSDDSDITGFGKIDVRFDENDCQDVLDVCCINDAQREESIRPKPIKNVPTQESGCGVRNVGGLDFELAGAYVSWWLEFGCNFGKFAMHIVVPQYWLLMHMHNF